MSRNWKKIVCAISGGVDSAVAAILLKRRGYQVVGLFMKNWDIVDENGTCSINTDLEDAQFVCKQLKIPLYTVDFVKEYWNQVFSSFLQDYQKGLTPNPDILCNKHIKFDAFLKYAISRYGADAIATGHYACTSLNTTSFHRPPSSGEAIKLLKAADAVKDQTFFLAQISQQALKKTLFPIGHLRKDQVRQIAIEENLQKIAKKKESMGICFIGSRNFKTFIKEYIEPLPGKFVNIETGKTLGQHEGIHMWTLGQRIHLGGCHHAYFVTEINSETNDIIVAPGTTHPALFCTSFKVDNPHWICPQPDWLESKSMAVDFRFQHAHRLITCELKSVSSDGSTCIVNLPHPMRAISPGQYAVFYKGDECIGSAQIKEVGPSLWKLNHREPIKLAKEFT